jgi:hypothetical protein
MDLCKFLRRYRGPAEGLNILFRKDEIIAQISYSDDLSRVREVLENLISAFGLSMDPGRGTILQAFLSESRSSLSSNLLDHLFHSTWDAFESQEAGRLWLTILQKLGVDVRQYLQNELQIRGDVALSCLPGRDWTLFGRTKRIFISTEPGFVLRWDWWTPASGSAALVLEEFANLGTGPPRHLYLEDESLHWPFNFSNSFCHHRAFNRQCEAEKPYYFKQRLNRMKLTSQRRIRREERKLAKQLRLEGPFLGSVPGAWIS